MPNFISLVLAAMFAMFAFGAPVQAQSANTGAHQGAIAALSEKQRHRMDYYAAQTQVALEGFTLSSQNESALTDLRQKVQRLSDAGQRSGLAIPATALYLEAYLAENATAALPVALLDSAGSFDAVSLLTSVQTYFDNLAPAEIDVSAVEQADMAAISSIAQNRQVQELTAPVQPVVVAALPKIPPDAPAEVRAILERVRTDGENWVITVEQGDSLAQFADAIYGDPSLFQQVFEANISQLITPSSILVGQNIILPKP